MVDTRARKCLRTERSVDRHGASSSRTRGSPIRAICADRLEGGGEVRNAEGGAIRSKRGAPASKAEQSASGAKLSALSTEQSDAQRERKLQGAEQSANGSGRKVLSAESNRRPAPGRRSGTRSNPREAEKAKCRARSNPRPARTAKCGGQQLGTYFTERSRGALSNECASLHWSATVLFRIHSCKRQG